MVRPKFRVPKVSLLFLTQTHYEKELDPFPYQLLPGFQFFYPGHLCSKNGSTANAGGLQSFSCDPKNIQKEQIFRKTGRDDSLSFPVSCGG